MNVLMIGAGRTVRGGVSTVVNGYYEAGLDRRVDLTYLPTMEDGSKPKKLMVAAGARILFENHIRKADILHVHMSADASFHRKAVFIRRAAALSRKIIIHMHGSTFDGFYLERCNDKGKRKVRDIFALADAVIALSDYWRDFMADNICDADKIQVLYNSVPLPAVYKGRIEDYRDQNLLFMGIIGRRKGAFDLIGAMKRVVIDHPKARLYMGGDGEVEEARSLIKEYGLEDHIRLLGWVRGERREKAFSRCSLYLLPSYNEGMPMSVLEAMGRGLCTISTPVGGIPHIIRDGENGRLIEPGDVAGLADCIGELLSDREQRFRLGQAARATVAEDFDTGKSIDRLLEIYRGLLQ